MIDMKWYRAQLFEKLLWLSGFMAFAFILGVIVGGLIF
jgi:hypothetical protein